MQFLLALPAPWPAYRWGTSSLGNIDVGRYQIAAALASMLAPRHLLPCLTDGSKLSSTDPAAESGWRRHEVALAVDRSKRLGEGQQHVRPLRDWR